MSMMTANLNTARPTRYLPLACHHIQCQEQDSQAPLQCVNIRLTPLVFLCDQRLTCGHECVVHMLCMSSLKKLSPPTTDRLVAYGPVIAWRNVRCCGPPWV